MKRTALFMILLVLTMPMYSALVSAEIRSIDAHGADSVPGYRRINGDFTEIVVEAKILNDESITPEQLAIATGVSTRPFTGTCEPIDALYYRCSTKTSQNSLDGIARSINFRIDLRDDAGELVDRDTGTLTYDDAIPSISIGQIEQRGDILAVRYTAKDRACAHVSCAGKCSGIQEIVFGDHVVDVNSGDCSISGEAEVPLQQDGEVILPVTVVDRVRNGLTVETPPILVDRSVPFIDPQSFAFLKANMPVLALGRDGVSGVHVKVRVGDDALQSVSADFSALNTLPNYRESYRSLPAQCFVVSDGLFQCSWNDIFLLPSSTDGTVTITGTDVAGNSIINQIPFHFVVDETVPVLEAIRTNGCADGICYVRNHNNVLAVDIREPDSGFIHTFFIDSKRAHRVALDVSEMSSRLRKVWADECTSDGSGLWTCLFHDVDAFGNHGREFTLGLADGSRDDAGNAVKGGISQKIMLDTRDPVVTAVNLTAGDVHAKFLLEGHSLNAEATVEDDSPVLGSLSSQVALADAVAFDVECSGDSVQTCIWEGVSQLAPGPLVDAPFDFVFKDLAGNIEDHVVKQTVVVSETEEHDYWRVGGISHSPAKINRDTLFVEQKMFFTVPLTAAGNVDIIDVRVDSCTGDTNYLATEPSIMHVNGRTAYMEATVAPYVGSLDDVSSIKVSCALDIISLVNEERVSLPQLLPVSLEIPLASFELGGLGGNVDALLAEARDYQISILNKWFGWLEPLFTTFEKICQILKITDSLQRLSSVFGGGLGLGGLLGGARGGQAVQGGLSQVGQKYSSGRQDENGFLGLRKYCKYISCDKGLWDTAYKKLTVKEPKWSKERHLGAVPYPQNTRDSLVLSLATGCLPGIIHNLKKYKQTHCLYVDCLQNQVPKGVSVQYCTDQFHYLKCRFVYGQVFELIPYAHFMRRMGTYVKTIFANPVTLIFGIGGLCKSKALFDFSSLPPAFCDLTSAVATFGTIKQDFAAIKGMKNLLSNDNSGRDVCEEVGLGKGVK